MNKVEKLVDCIGPSLRSLGRKALIFSINKACLIIAEAPNGAFDQFQVTRDIYLSVANQIGRSLGKKPKPSEIILYCAYYVVYGVPYQEALSHPDLPKPF